MEMSSEEMRRRLAEGESPIALSAEKWARIAEFLKTCDQSIFPTTDASTCALCEYSRETRVSPFVGCADCPLAQAGYECDEQGSPWTKTQEAIGRFMAIVDENAVAARQDAIDAALEMRDVILSLKNNQEED